LNSFEYRPRLLSAGNLISSVFSISSKI
jgi:hypothetical protein